MQWQLNCPACGIAEVEQGQDGADHEAVTVHPDRDSGGSPLGTRGGYVSVELTCAAGHGFDFIVSNHNNRCDFFATMVQAEAYINQGEIAADSISR